jgi:hypothetical protein
MMQWLVKLIGSFLVKTTDLPSLCPVYEVSEFQEPSDTYNAVVGDSTLFGLQYAYQKPYLWDMIDVIDEPFFEIEIHIYDNYHAQ